jgi:hypothetical protein
MDCQSARLLLTFATRAVEGVDPGEQALLCEHLEQCPDCAALADAERQTDAVLGAALRDVPVPEGLEARILQNLTAQRRPFPYWIPVAAALILCSLGVASYVLWNKPTELTIAGLIEHFEDSPKTMKDPDKVEDWFLKHGVEMQAPPQFKYQFFRDCEIVLFQGRKVPMLLFQDGDILVQVYVLSARHFDLRNIAKPGPQSQTILLLPDPANDPEVVYLVYSPQGHLPRDMWKALQ